ncbi:hypothetical protein CLOSYM_02257 [[Clostridium] symbiosum ATCC 14940]|uniref:Uncharacterized protein n=1 Tax=[Clostridium] symbiosum ATCC 14940 TaxID=411472 RepID=A0ABC9TY12_CLOSY|nr:hypothetical protein CLOSYM_02257 [[Clostridium] symbiosum ATCC 14940]
MRGACRLSFDRKALLLNKKRSAAVGNNEYGMKNNRIIHNLLFNK